MKFQMPYYVRKQMLVALCANLAHVMIGYTIGWNSPVIPKLQDPAQSPLAQPISLSQASWLGASFIIGGIVGPFFTVKLSNVIGRRYCLGLGVIISVIGSVIRLVAGNYATLFAGRVIGGFGQGVVGVLNLVYIGEIASPNIRGTLLTSTATCHTFGVLIAYAAGPRISFHNIEHVFLGICGLYFLGLLTIPESPLFYILRGKKEDAIKVLQILGRNKDIDKELKSLSEDVVKIENSNFNLKEMIAIKSNRKSLLITSSLYIFQECSGLLAIASFLMTIFEKAGTAIDPATASLTVGVTQFLVSMIAPVFIDFLGRKTLLLISTAGCSVCMAVLGIYFYLDSIHYAPLNDVGWIPLCAVVLTYCSFGIGLNIVPNTILAEMYRPNVRSLGISVSMVLGWVAGTLSIVCFGYIVEAVGRYVVFSLYTVINVLGFIFICIAVPETKRLSLTDIEQILSKSTERKT